MEKLNKALKEKLNNASFKTLVEVLDKTKDHEIRGIILNTMEIEHEEEFLKWIG